MADGWHSLTGDAGGRHQDHVDDAAIAAAGAIKVFITNADLSWVARRIQWKRIVDFPGLVALKRYGDKWFPTE